MTGTLMLEISQCENGATVIACAGALDMATAPELADAVAWSMTTDLRELDLDGSEITFCDSAGLRCLFETAVLCLDGGVQFQVVPGGSFARILKLCGIPLDHSPLNGDTLVADLTATLSETVVAKLGDAAPAPKRA